MDAAAAGDEIVVTNGIYAAGGRAVYGTMTNRVAVDKPLMLRSVNGPQFTLIRGFQVPGSTNGDGAVRCVYLTNGASLSGFTLTNGATRSTGDDSFEKSGGGVLCASLTAVVSNCKLTGNSAYIFGGGAVGGTLNNCTVSGNSARAGGGASVGTLNNCIVYFNTAPLGANYWYGTLNYSCTTPQPTNGLGNITNAPLFIDQASGNLRLQSNSPCINAGLNAFAPAGPDLDGNPRIVGGTVDMGAYEYQSLSLISFGVDRKSVV